MDRLYSSPSKPDSSAKKELPVNVQIVDIPLHVETAFNAAMIFAFNDALKNTPEMPHLIHRAFQDKDNPEFLASHRENAYFAYGPYFLEKLARETGHAAMFRLNDATLDLNGNLQEGDRYWQNSVGAISEALRMEEALNSNVRKWKNDNRCLEEIISSYNQLEDTHRQMGTVSRFEQNPVYQENAQKIVRNFMQRFLTTLHRTVRETPMLTSGLPYISDPMRRINTGGSNLLSGPGGR